MKIKICGVRDLAAARACARAGVDAVGFVFAASPRRIAPAEARRIAADLPDDVERVAVFRLARVEEVRRVLDAFPADRVQVEPERALLAAFGARLLPVLHDDGSLEGRAAGLDPDRPVVLEAAGRGGRGVRPDWAHAATLARRRPVMLAGGLDPDNVAAAIRTVRPWGVDVSSGVESSRGVKSGARIAAFVAAVRRTMPEEC
ncbi:MAG: phosphoribosylanthranilate isomerase [Gemmatimonadota bacterium]